MTKHEEANVIYALEAKFLRIKSLSTCGAIDEICVKGLSKCVDLSLYLKCENELKEIKDRLIADPMA
jgi:hypothetical protein